MTVKEVDPPAIASAPVTPAEAEVARRVRPEPTFLQVFTLVLWVTCLVVGLLGLWLAGRLAPAKPPPPKLVDPPPVQAELIEVAMTTEKLAPAATDSPPPAPAPDARADPPPPEAPPLPAVAAPSPAIAFSVPVAGPVRIVPADRAAAGRVAPAPKAPVQHLVYGVGTTAALPQPEYPDAAKFAHQEGVVGIQFTVAPGGRVNDASIVEPSRFPLLNQSALRTVREEWADPRWVPGTIYLISIRFQLNQL